MNGSPVLRARLMRRDARSEMARDPHFACRDMCAKHVEGAQMSPQELQGRQKCELEKKQESPARGFLPNTDIFARQEALDVVLEMPGVNKNNVAISIASDVLLVEGRLDFSKYEALPPLYTEYNIGNYRRSSLSNKVDQNRVSAEMQDGVLTIVLPRAEEAKPRRISIA
jgi:HSP20 family molecular chaperone IbpA